MNPENRSRHPATVDETLAIISQVCLPLDSEQVPLDEALGRVLRVAAVACEDQPPFDRSSVDGYAVHLDDPSPSFRVVAHIWAGDWKPMLLKPGEAVSIATGAPLPGPGLQVIMKEDATVEGDTVHFHGRGTDLNIRFRGEDAPAGTMLVQPGARLNPGTLALLASAGCARPSVTRLPRVLHVATGNEIVPPGKPLGPGKIRDSNTTFVRAFLEECKISPVQLRVSEDEAEARQILHARFEHETPDVLLVSGGASVGPHDFTAPLLEHLGYTILVSRTTTRPGKPLIFASKGAGIAFGLPGNPLAHFVCLHLYVRAALLGMSGASATVTFSSGVLATDMDAGCNTRETLWPARFAPGKGGAEVTPLPWRSSGDLTCLASANALLRVPPSTTTLQRGTNVTFLPTTPWP